MKNNDYYPKPVIAEINRIFYDFLCIVGRPDNDYIVYQQAWSRSTLQKSYAERQN